MPAKQRPLTVGAVWMPDDEAPRCCNRLCKNEKFSLVNRRHHCRWCGRVYCDKCAPASPTGHQRKCNSCRVPIIFTPYVLKEGGCPQANPMEAILSFLDKRSINALLQTSSNIHQQFHIAGIGYQPTVQKRFPSLFTGAQVGRGGAGTVYRVEDREHNDLVVAVKVMTKACTFSYHVWLRLVCEIDIMRDNNHPNVAKLIETFQTPKELVIVVELGEGGSLRHAFEVVKKKKYDTQIFTAHVIGQVAQGLKYLYEERGRCAQGHQS